MQALRKSIIRFAKLPSSGAESTAETIEKMLVASAKAVRAYFYPNMASLNAPTGDGDSGGEFQDILPQLRQESLLTSIIASEEQSERKLQQSQISDALIAALSKLNEEEQTIIKLYYSQGLTQQQIAQKLEVKQYTVSRRLAKSQDTLLRKLATWIQESLHISLNSQVLDYISIVLEEWLKVYYTHPSSLQEQ
jgi:RNA polymerase sigma factor (sigma-70 family)